MADTYRRVRLSDLLRALDFPRPGGRAGRILDLLLSAWSAPISIDRMINELWGARADGGPDNAYAQVRTAVSHLRAQGFVIENRYCGDYRLIGWIPSAIPSRRAD